MMRRMDHTGLTVSDMERSIDFYCNVLGLKLVRRMNVAEEFLSQIVGFHEVNLDIALLKADEEEHIIELLQYISHPGETNPSETNRTGNGHVCFEVDDIWANYENLKSKGVTFVNPPAMISIGRNIGAQAVYFRDPDGITLEMRQVPPKT